MAITYDKKMLIRMHNNVDGGKVKFALKSSFLFSIIYFIIMLGLMYLVQKKTNEDFIFDLTFVMTWFLAAFFMFIIMYISNLRQYKDMKAMYEESIKYFEKHDRGFLKDLNL